MTRRGLLARVLAWFAVGKATTLTAYTGTDTTIPVQPIAPSDEPAMLLVSGGHAYRFDPPAAPALLDAPPQYEPGAWLLGNGQMWFAGPDHLANARFLSGQWGAIHITNYPLREARPVRAADDGVWCARCQRVHCPFTQDDYDGIVRDAAKTMADAIDADVAARVYGEQK